VGSYQLSESRFKKYWILNFEWWKEYRFYFFDEIDGVFYDEILPGRERFFDGIYKINRIFDDIICAVDVNSKIITYYKGEIMGIHSKILVHWTGKDIENPPEANKSKLYVDRLKDYYENGLFAERTKIPENTIRVKKIKHLLRICFTEIRLSQAQTHAEQYGKLGIGFKRDFIMDKGGRPVIYIPYKGRKGNCLLEDSIRVVYDKSNKEIQRAAKWIMAHVKRMSDSPSEDNYYEEMEWRVVYDENPDNKHFVEGERKGVRRLKFKAEDIKVIIFPDDETKKMALEDEVIGRYFSKHIPMIATLEDCGNF